MRLVEEQEKELKTKKYGLVWDSEREPEQVVLNCENNLPVLERLEDEEIRTNDGEDNILIEGDNYHALTVLNYTHKEKIDVIYIDPPFNTGSTAWKFNNKYVDKEDAFKHSKWLSFINHRIEPARNLLKDTGIILVAIDDYEHHTLRLLMDKVFGENNRLGTIVVVHNPGGRSDDEFVATAHEYMLIYAKNRNLAKINLLPYTEEQLEDYGFQDGISRFKLQPFRRTGSNSRREDRPNLYYPIFYDPKTKELSLSKKSANFVKILPIDSRGGARVWRWGKDHAAEKFDTEFVVRENGVKFTISVKKRYFGGSDEGFKSKTFWFGPRYNASTHGTILLQNILHEEKPFDYPKSLYTVKDALLIAGDSSSVVCDFFAGSGTTGHAVLELNKEDNGSRKFILCTNNEDNNGNGYKIAEDICYPRIKKVIEGYTDLKGRKVEGLGGNLQYFKTGFVKRTKNSDQLKLNLTQKCTQMLCVKENIFNLKKEGPDYKIFSSNKEDRFLCIYYNFKDDSFEKFLAEAKKLEGRKIIYMFSVDNVIDEKLFGEIKNFSIEAIPQQILDIYKQLIRLSVRRK